MPPDLDLFYARRLGLGLRPGESLLGPVRDWALDQLRDVPPFDFIGQDGNSMFEKLKFPADYALFKNFEEACRNWEIYKVKEKRLDSQSGKGAAGQYRANYHREIYQPYIILPRWRDCLAKTLTCVNGRSPVFERFWMFWTNHFTVSTPEVEIKLFYGPHIRNIRNRLTGSFENLLFDAVINPAMLLYLNNDTSTGPNSRAAKRETRFKDLNENLARELLELHTMSPAGGYSQKDVVETALILTGWQMYGGPVTNGGSKEKIPYGTRFNPYRHEPGTRTVLGKTYRAKASGENQLRELLRDLAHHPQTARFLAFKLARHFLADIPPQGSVDRIAAAFERSKGNLIAVHSAVVVEVLAHGMKYSKLTTPENWLLQAYRATGTPVPISTPTGEAALHIFKEIGQSFDECPQPNGYSDLKEDWLSKEMLDRRVRQAYRIGQSLHDLTVETAADYAGRLAGSDSPLVTTVQRAESRAEAVALLLASPQFLKI